MMRLLSVDLILILSSLAFAAPVNNTTQQTELTSPNNDKGNTTEKMKMKEVKSLNEKDKLSDSVTSVETASEGTEDLPSSTYATDEESSKSGSIISVQQPVENTTRMSLTPKTDESNGDDNFAPDDTSAVNAESSEMPVDTTDGLIEYNLGNPLALRLHLPWWPLKDMLKSIQDAISLMNLTMSRDTLDADATKTKTVTFDDRNYTLKVRVFKPSEKNRLLVRLISLTPVIEEGEAPTAKGTKIEEEKENEALTERAEKHFTQLNQKEDKNEETKKADDDVDEREKKSKGQDSKKEKRDKKKNNEKAENDSDRDSD